MSDKIALDDVRHVARLARLGLTDAHARAIMRDLNTILDHMDVLERVETSGVSEYVATDTPMLLRDDHGPAIPLAALPETFAPAMRDGLFVVPRLATHEDSQP